MRDFKDVTLLLVEDDDIDAISIERSFFKQRVGNTIIRANDGLEALELMLGDKIPQPYIVLLDLQMPRMNGIEFLEKLRANPELSKTIVFVLTTSKADHDMVASYEKNVAGYFVKDEAGVNFIDVVKVLDSYWKVVQLPVTI